MLLEAELQKVPKTDQVGDTKLLVAELDTLAGTKVSITCPKVSITCSYSQIPDFIF
jgi:hypothetical protein